MKVYAYYFKSESCDEILIMSSIKYKDVFDFMRNEVDWEYEAWKQDSYKDEDIPYCTFIMHEFDTNTLVDTLLMNS